MSPSSPLIELDVAARGRRDAGRLRSVFAALPSGLLILDGQGRIAEANQAAEGLLGIPLQGESWLVVIQRAFSPRQDDGHEVSLRDGRLVQLTTSPLRDEPGQLVVITDLTPTRQLQARVAHMQRLSALGHMAASLAHQIRTPLSAAMLYGANLANRTLSLEARSNFQRKLMDRLRDLEQQVSDVLLFAKSEEHLAVSELSVQGLLQQVQAGAEAMMNQAGARLDVSLPEPDLLLLANGNALSSAINNLLANALQAGARALLVSAERQAEQVAIRVVDNGKGMAPELVQQIFEPFFTTRSQGTGLGLAVVQSVIQAHQGTVAVASVPGEGSCFTLLLPLQRQQAATVAGGVA